MLVQAGRLRSQACATGMECIYITLLRAMRLILLAITILTITVPAQAQGIDRILDSWTYQGSGAADSAASDGQSLPLGHWEWKLFSLPPGRYRIRFRLKAASNTGQGSFTASGKVIWGYGYGFPAPNEQETPLSLPDIKLTDFNKPQVYQEFTMEFRHDQASWIFLEGSRQGETSIWLDRVDLELLEQFPQKESPLQMWRLKGMGVKDTDAVGGQAARLDSMPTSFDNLPMGRYRAVLRLKKASIREPGKIRIVCSFGGAGGSGLAGADGDYLAQPTSFRGGKYDEFSFPFAILYPSGRAGFSLYAQEGRPLDDLLVDYIELDLMERYTETQALEITKVPRPTLQLIPHQGTRVWLAEGLYAEQAGLLSGIQSLKVDVAHAWLIDDRGNFLLGGQVLQPYQAAEVAPIGMNGSVNPSLVQSPLLNPSLLDLVILDDIPGQILSLQQRALLHDYVEAGGGLLVVGGMFGLDRGGYQGSDLLSSLLPVTLSESPTLHKLPEPALLQTLEDSPITRGLNFGVSPLVCWMHNTTPKKGASVILSAGNNPVLVTWSFGKGRVAVLTAPPLGEPTSGSAYWQWSDWSTLMSHLLSWLAVRNVN